MRRNIKKGLFIYFIILFGGGIVVNNGDWGKEWILKLVLIIALKFMSVFFSSLF